MIKSINTIKEFAWRKCCIFCSWILVFIILLVTVAYLCGMIIYNGPFIQAGWGNGLLASIWTAVMAIIFFRNKLWKVRMLWWAVGIVIVVVPFLTICPSNDKHWEAEYNRTGYASVDGDVVKLYNVRNFKHYSRDEFDERWESRTYRLSNLRGLDYVQSNFLGDLLAHPILSFDFGEQGRICLSVETRREVGEKFTPFGGLYKMFELQYLFITELDCIPLRTKIRKETVRRYTIDARPEKIREMFIASVKIQNELMESPRFYNVIHSNCTTSLRAQQSRSDQVPWDRRLLFNGRLDEYLYEQGMLQTEDDTFEELRQKAIVRGGLR